MGKWTLDVILKESMGDDKAKHGRVNDPNDLLINGYRGGETSGEKVRRGGQENRARTGESL